MNQFKRAERNRCKIKLAIQGPSGSGKTYSALLLAYGLTKDWSKIAVIDSENGSANLYAELGAYSVLALSQPYSPESYCDALDLAVKSGFECVVIDSLSHEWNGQGGVLDIHSNISGNSFTAWAKVTPRHNTFVQAVLQSNVHVIGTMRSKTDYVLTEKNGKQVPEKVGLKAVQREDAEYEFTIVFELNQRHQANVSKDRTGLFRSKPELVLTEDVGSTIAQWCNSGGDVKPVEFIQPAADSFETEINRCKTISELMDLYNFNPDKQLQYRESFMNRKTLINLTSNTLSNNGVHH